MKARVDVVGMSVEIEGAGIKELIKEFSLVQGALAFENCGVCKSREHGVAPQHRNVEGNDFYEIKCKNPTCGAVLRLGSHKDSPVLYKKRMKVDTKGKAIKEDGKSIYLENGGWKKWTPESDKED